MNRKNTILIAVFINAGLLIVLFVAALITNDPQPSVNIVENQTLLPQFDDLPQIQEPLQLENKEEPIVHNLPPLNLEIKPEAAIELPPVAVSELPSLTPQNQIIVKKGDHLEKIAKKHGTTVAEIIKLNNLPNTALKIGQVLKMPASCSIADTKQSAPEYYTIKVGENPWAIANKHRMKVHELLKLNGLNEEKARKLKPGDRLRIR